MGASHAYDEWIILDAADLPADDAHCHFVGRKVSWRHARFVANHQGNRTDIGY